MLCYLQAFIIASTASPEEMKRWYVCTANVNFSAAVCFFSIPFDRWLIKSLDININSTWLPTYLPPHKSFKLYYWVLQVQGTCCVDRLRAELEAHEERPANAYLCPSGECLSLQHCCTSSLWCTLNCSRKYMKYSGALVVHWNCLRHSFINSWTKRWIVCFILEGSRGPFWALRWHAEVFNVLYCS